jgi:hypothetical protein
MTLTCTANTSAAVSATSVFVNFGVPITNPYFGTPQTVRLINPTGIFSSSPPTFAEVSNISGYVGLQIPAISWNGNDTGSITLSGVEVSLDGSGKTSLDVTAFVSSGSALSMDTNLNRTTPIGQVLQGLSDPVISPAAGGTAALRNDGMVMDSTFGFTIAENYVDMFQAAAQYDAQRATNATQILLTFNGIPPGVVIGGCSVAAAVSGNPSPGSPVLSGGVTTISSASNQVTIDWSGSPDLTAVETITFKCTSIDTEGAARSFPAGNVTVTASLAPDGVALNSNGSPLTGSAIQIPRYSLSPVPASPLVVVTITRPKPRGQVTSQD